MEFWFGDSGKGDEVKSEDDVLPNHVSSTCPLLGLFVTLPNIYVSSTLNLSYTAFPSSAHLSLTCIIIVTYT